MKPVEIANTILKQIQHSRVGDNSGALLMMCWGVHNISTVGKDKYHYGGVQFMVNGFKHKGWVSIKLHYNDSYTVTFLNKYDKFCEGPDVYEYILYPELAEFLDKHIETGIKEEEVL